MEPLAPGCFWYDWYTRYPHNIEWCEARVCSLILTPFNTWTNLAYIFLGIYAWYQSRQSPSRVLRTFGPSIVIIGITSFAYHASLNYFTHLLDFFGMYLFAMTFVMLNLLRAKRWPAPPQAFYWFWASVVLLMSITLGSLMIDIHFPVQVYVLFLILYVIKTEFAVTAPSRRDFWLTVLCFAIAAVFSALDVSHIWCVPDRHWLQGHGIWHMTNCLGLYFAYRHYQQFEGQMP